MVLTKRKKSWSDTDLSLKATTAASHHEHDKGLHEVTEGLSQGVKELMKTKQVRLSVSVLPFVLG